MSEKKVIETKVSRFWPVYLWLFVALLVGLAIGIWQYQKMSSANQPPADNSVVKQANTEAEVIAAVGRLMILPQEKPAVAVITEVEKIKPVQPFFVDASNGDRILVYKDKAIIYNPKLNKIINVGPISLIKSNDEINGPWKLEIRNGSSTKGAAAKLADTLAADKTLEIVSVSNAAHNEYQGNVLINLSGRDVTNLAEKLSVSATTSLPEAEASTSAELLLIIGN